METIQQTMKRTQLAFETGLPTENKRRKIIVVTIGIVVLCGWALLALYSLVGGRQNELNFALEVVYVPQAPAPATGSGPSFYTGSRRSGTLMYKPSAVSYQHSSANYAPAPKATMGSTSFRVHQTSSATVHFYGAGGTGGVSSATYKRRSANNSGGGINYTAIAYSGSIYVPTAHNAVTAVGASSAGNVVASRMGAPRRLKMDNGEGEWPEEPEDPAPDPEPPVPAGNVPWVLMALLATGYIGYKKKKYAYSANNCE